MLLYGMLAFNAMKVSKMKLVDPDASASNKKELKLLIKSGVDVVMMKTKERSCEARTVWFTADDFQSN